jgi:hypothetical protein
MHDMVEFSDWGVNDLRGRPYVTDGRTITPATDEVLAEVAAEAMLLSQGAARAIELRRHVETSLVNAR